MTMMSRELPEIRYASKSKGINQRLKLTAHEHDKKSTERKRQIDRNIYLTTKDLNDIETKTTSPPRTLGVTAAWNQRSCWKADDNDSSDQSSATSHRHNRFGNNNDYLVDVSHPNRRLVHVRTRTRRNFLLSQKLSYQLEVMEERRSRNRYPSPSASVEQHLALYRPISSRSMEDLEKAASVLKFTQHEGCVQQLLCTVSLKDNSISLKDSSISSKGNAVSLKDNSISSKDNLVSLRDHSISSQGNNIVSLKDHRVSVRSDSASKNLSSEIS